MSQRRVLFTFRELVESEHEQIEKAGGTTEKFNGKVEMEVESGEPWVVKTDAPRVGLALSGGGIRSATFGLGLLQSLARQRVLGMVDYLSTVSGGGYLGGFWTAWKQRTGNNEVFPDAERGEGAEVRHLREFSRFLAPRIGLNEPETWNAVAAVLGGMFPALLATMAAIALVVYAWLFVGYLAAGEAVTVTWEFPWGMLVATGLAVGGALCFPKVKRTLRKKGPMSVYWAFSHLGLVVVLFGSLWGLCWWMESIEVSRMAVVFGVASLALHALFEWTAWRKGRSERGRHELLWHLSYWIMALVTTVLGMWVVALCDGVLKAGPPAGVFGPALGFAPAIGWACAGLAVSVAWIGVERLAASLESALGVMGFDRDAMVGFRLRRAQLQERLTSSYLKWACVFAAIVLVWNLAAWVSAALEEKAGPSLGASGGLTVIFTGFFAYVREWLTKPDKESVGGSVWEMFKGAFRQWLPMAAATAGALCLIVFTLLIIRYYGLKKSQVEAVVPCSLIIVFVAVKFFDPAYVSLHGFYRARIARAYLGAAFVKGRAWLRYEESERKHERVIRKLIEDHGSPDEAFHLIGQRHNLEKKLGTAMENGERIQSLIEEQVEALRSLLMLRKTLNKWLLRKTGGLVEGQVDESSSLLTSTTTSKKWFESFIQSEEALQKKGEALRERASRAQERTTARIDKLVKELEALDQSIRKEIKAAAANGNADALMKLRERADGERRRKPSSRDNRFSSERSLDDLCLTKLEHPDVRPVHLICCAANHLSGDDLPNLYRGARSAVLSQRGITLGDDTVTPGDWDPPLMLSSAQTASAAAFNSQMGEKSFRLGRGGSFLMTALNLRLGLWVMNPVRVRADVDAEILENGREAPERKGLTSLDEMKRVFEYFWEQVPGLAFYSELIRSSKCLPEDLEPHLHLSDGAHFENLGLYELIRRHCRYIILSDAAQDETVAFDDLGNAIRRVREDFGVEIEIALDPLRPDEKRISGQHAVVGTIHYDGKDGTDKGTLIYIKPSLTGDEPADIQQYRTRNKKFPHESTGDQFFSEAQWESYRRLGEHTGDEVFAFLKKMKEEDRTDLVKIFEEAKRYSNGAEGEDSCPLAFSRGRPCILKSCLSCRLRAVVPGHGTPAPVPIPPDSP